jgi:hypothetical protein
MKKSELKRLIAEVVKEVLNKVWDVEEYDVNMAGKLYSVDAKFEWHEDAVAHRHDPRTDIGQDYIAEVPYKVENIEAFDMSSGNPIQVQDASILEKLSDVTLEQFLDTEESRRNGYWQR